MSPCFKIPTYKKQLQDVIIGGVYCYNEGYGLICAWIVNELIRKNKTLRFVPIRYDESSLNLGIQDPLKNALITPKMYDLFFSNNYLEIISLVERDSRGIMSSLIEEPSKKVLLTMFEAVSIPNKRVKYFNSLFDTVVVPSNFCKDVFVDCGVKNVQMIDLGININEFPFVCREIQENKPFTFLVLAHCDWKNPRKNYKLIYDTFVELFKNNKMAKMIFHLPHINGMPPIHPPDNVEIKIGIKSRQAVFNLYKEADVLAFATAGEGFGIPPREAMSTGLPCIVTNWGGLSKLCQVQGLCYPVETKGLKHIIYEKGHVGEQNDFETHVADVDENSLVEMMLLAFNNREKNLKMGKFAAQWVRENEDIKFTVQKLIDLFKI